MIRVEITETMWQAENGMPCNSEPVDAGAEIPILKTERTLLVQEFTDLNIKPIVALLNRLHETPLCTCGHQYHEGQCHVNISPTAVYGSNRTCDCRRYETQAEADLRKVTDKFVESECTLASTETKLEAAQDELARVIRSRDRLRIQKGKKR